MLKKLTCQDDTFGTSDSCYLLTGNLRLDVVLLDKDGTRVFEASIAEVENQGCPVGGRVHRHILANMVPLSHLPMIQR